MAFDPVTFGIKAVGAFFGSKKKKKARRRQATANRFRATISSMLNQARRTALAKSHLAAVAEGKVSSQQAGGTLRGSSTQGQISGSRAAFEGQISDSRVTEGLGLEVNRWDAAAASSLRQAGEIQGWTDLLAGAKQEWDSYQAGKVPKGSTITTPKTSGPFASTGTNIFMNTKSPTLDKLKNFPPGRG